MEPDRSGIPTRRRVASRPRSTTAGGPEPVFGTGLGVGRAGQPVWGALKRTVNQLGLRLFCGGGSGPCGSFVGVGADMLGRLTGWAGRLASHSLRECLYGT